MYTTSLLAYNNLSCCSASKIFIHIYLCVFNCTSSRISWSQRDLAFRVVRTTCVYTSHVNDNILTWSIREGLRSSANRQIVRKLGSSHSANIRTIVCLSRFCTTRTRLSRSLALAIGAGRTCYYHEFATALVRDRGAIPVPPRNDQGRTKLIGR
jgi:hypothetical protein